jgi:hypothetical protein
MIIRIALHIYSIKVNRLGWRFNDIVRIALKADRQLT